MRTLLALMLAMLAACSSTKHADYDRALASAEPPEDFWLAVTVLRPPAEAASRAAAYQQLAVAMRPARYIVEADRVLRAATGSGASETTFPDQTRQLTDAQFNQLWETLRTSSLVKGDHPAQVGAAPPARSTLDQTTYVISFAAAGNRRVLAIDAEPKPSAGVEEAKALVEEVAALAWVR